MYTLMGGEKMLFKKRIYLDWEKCNNEENHIEHLNFAQNNLSHYWGDQK